MAKQLIESLGAAWKPEKYSDDYRANLMRIIKAKMKGKEAKLVEEKRPQSAEVVDLMERLRQSLAGRAASTPRGKAARRKKPTRRAAA